VTFDPRNGYELGESHHVVLRLVGRRVEMLQTDQPPLTDLLDPGMSRRGGFGFALPPGSRVTISRCRATILR
jgi:hypothetical protein